MNIGSLHYRMVPKLKEPMFTIKPFVIIKNRRIFAPPKPPRV